MDEPEGHTIVRNSLREKLRKFPVRDQFLVTAKVHHYPDLDEQPVRRAEGGEN